MCPSLIEIGSKTAEKTLHKQTNRQTDRHYENNGHLAVNQYLTLKEDAVQDNTKMPMTDLRLL